MRERLARLLGRRTMAANEQGAMPRHVNSSPATPAIERYLADGLDQVAGWGIDAFLARVLVGLDQFQKARGIEGNLLEIGVFQGRTGVLLALMAVPPQVAVLIDLFDAGDSPTARHGGNGDLQALQANLARWAPGASVDVVKADSHALDFAANAGIRRGLRFAHVDGGHDKATVLNDLAKCAAHIVDAGLLVVDDFWHSGFPEVNEACNQYLASQDRLQPVAIGKNKLVLAPALAAPEYRRWFAENLRPPVGRSVRFHDHDAYCLDALG